MVVDTLLALSLGIYILATFLFLLLLFLVGKGRD